MKNITSYLVSALALVISIFHIWANSFGNVSTLTQNGLHFSGFVLLAALIGMERRHSGPSCRWSVLWLGLGLVMAILAASSALYLIYAEDAIYSRGVRLNILDWLAAIIVVISAIEFTRRTTGWIIPIIIVIAMTYLSLWGPHVKGIFAFAGLSFESLMFRSIYGDDAIFGTIAGISSTFVFMFILFGAFLHSSGASMFIIDIARLLTKRFTGAPGFVAVIASALTGTISGSAVANTVSTGVVTIPLMKRSGFSPHFAAGVEAASSTGGQIMPPIMGAGAFVMAATTQIPYTHIVAMSILPAIMYFVSVGIFVRIHAMRLSHIPSPADEDDMPKLMDVLKRGGIAFIVPFCVLITLLVNGYTPTYAAGYAILSCIAATWLTPNRMGWRSIVDALILGARNMVMTAILLCSVGLIVNVISTAGVGNTFSLMITSWSGGNLFIAIVLIALASLVLGMGLPVTAAYIVLGTLSAPALYQMILQSQLADIIHLGTLPEAAKVILATFTPESFARLSTSSINLAEARELVASLPIEALSPLYDIALSPQTLMTALLTGHLIIFWLSQDSNVTPPVCLAAYTAAQIAKAPAMASGLAAWKTAKGLYVVPVLFAYTPLLSNDWIKMLEVTLFALPGLWALGAAIEGFGERRIGKGGRVVIALLGIGMLWPLSTQIHAVFMMAFVAFFIWHLRNPTVHARPTT